MTEPNSEHRRAGPAALRWQSQAVLLAFVPVAAIWVTLECGTEWSARPSVVWSAAIISMVLAALVHLTRAATLGAAITGAIFTAAFYLQTPGLHTALWPLLALLVLTFGATRFGRHRKEALGIAEARRGRTASQVAANLGVAAVAGIPQIMGQFSDVSLLVLTIHSGADAGGYGGGDGGHGFVRTGSGAGRRASSHHESAARSRWNGRCCESGGHSVWVRCRWFGGSGWG